MGHLGKRTRCLFAQWGKEGGERRKKALDAGERRAIAVRAAQARWGERRSDFSPASVRLNNPSWDDPVFLEEVIADGGLPEWRELYHRIAERPFGETADALGKVVDSVQVYGATNLWKALLRNLQGGAI